MTAPKLPRLSRRTVLKWFAAATAVLQLKIPAGTSLGAPAPPPAAKGYGTDPKVNGYYEPGDFWPLTLTVAQRRTTTALADLILPADHLGPAASTLRVHDFIDEWISAPYPAQRRDRATILRGLDWLERESYRRFESEFPALDDARKRAICDDICHLETAKPKLRTAALFFQRFRAIAAGAYYATEPGWRAIGYIGNVSLTRFEGPPREVLVRLGLERGAT